AKGLGLFPVVVALRQWGEDQLFAPGEAHSSLVEKASGQPVARMQPQTADGRVLAPGAAVVRKLG
ncbi:MAG: transcriptional regulator, partial [Comamonas sp.]|nr:transcriptional regulator [Comamonas sp.]